MSSYSSNRTQPKNNLTIGLLAEMTSKMIRSPSTEVITSLDGGRPPTMIFTSRGKVTKKPSISRLFRAETDNRTQPMTNGDSRLEKDLNGNVSEAAVKGGLVGTTSSVPLRRPAPQPPSEHSQGTPLPVSPPLIPAPKSFLERQSSLSSSTNSVTSLKRNNQNAAPHATLPPPQLFQDAVSQQSPPPHADFHSTNNNTRDQTQTFHVSNSVHVEHSETKKKSRAPEPPFTTQPLPPLFSAPQLSTPPPPASPPSSISSSNSSSPLRHFHFPPPPSSPPPPIDFPNTATVSTTTSLMSTPPKETDSDRKISTTPSEVMDLLDEAIGDQTFSTSTFNDGLSLPEFSPAFHYPSVSDDRLPEPFSPALTIETTPESHKLNYQTQQASETKPCEDKIVPENLISTHTSLNIEEDHKNKANSAFKSGAVIKLQPEVQTVRQYIKPGIVDELANLFSTLIEESSISPSKRAEISYDFKNSLESQEMFDKEHFIISPRSRPPKRTPLSPETLFPRVQSSVSAERLQERPKSLHSSSFSKVNQWPRLYQATSTPSVSTSSSVQDPQTTPSFDFLSASREMHKQVVLIRTNSKLGDFKTMGSQEDSITMQEVVKQLESKEDKEPEMKQVKQGVSEAAVEDGQVPASHVGRSETVHSGLQSLEETFSFERIEQAEAAHVQKGQSSLSAPSSVSSSRSTSPVTPSEVDYKIASGDSPGTTVNSNPTGGHINVLTDTVDLAVSTELHDEEAKSSSTSSTSSPRGSRKSSRAESITKQEQDIKLDTKVEETWPTNGSVHNSTLHSVANKSDYEHSNKVTVFSSSSQRSSNNSSRSSSPKSRRTSGFNPESLASALELNISDPAAAKDRRDSEACSSPSSSRAASPTTEDNLAHDSYKEAIIHPGHESSSSSSRRSSSDKQEVRQELLKTVDLDLSHQEYHKVVDISHHGPAEPDNHRITAEALTNTTNTVSHSGEMESRAINLSHDLDSTATKTTQRSLSHSSNTSSGSSRSSSRSGSVRRDLGSLEDKTDLEFEKMTAAARTSSGSYVSVDSQRHFDAKIHESQNATARRPSVSSSESSCGNSRRGSLEQPKEIERESGSALDLSLETSKNLVNPVLTHPDFGIKSSQTESLNFKDNFYATEVTAESVVKGATPPGSPTSRRSSSSSSSESSLGKNEETDRDKSSDLIINHLLIEDKEANIAEISSTSYLDEYKGDSFHVNTEALPPPADFLVRDSSASSSRSNSPVNIKSVEEQQVHAAPLDRSSRRSSKDSSRSIHIDLYRQGSLTSRSTATSMTTTPLNSRSSSRSNSPVGGDGDSSRRRSGFYDLTTSAHTPDLEASNVEVVSATLHTSLNYPPTEFHSEHSELDHEKRDRLNVLTHETFTKDKVHAAVLTDSRLSVGSQESGDTNPLTLAVHVPQTSEQTTLPPVPTQPVALEANYFNKEDNETYSLHRTDEGKNSTSLHVNSLEHGLATSIFDTAPKEVESGIIHPEEYSHEHSHAAKVNRHTGLESEFECSSQEPVTTAWTNILDEHLKTVGLNEYANSDFVGGIDSTDAPMAKVEVSNIGLGGTLGHDHITIDKEETMSQLSIQSQFGSGIGTGKGAPSLDFTSSSSEHSDTNSVDDDHEPTTSSNNSIQRATAFANNHDSVNSSFLDGKISDDTKKAIDINVPLMSLVLEDHADALERKIDSSSSGSDNENEDANSKHSDSARLKLDNGQLRESIVNQTVSVSEVTTISTVVEEPLQPTERTFNNSLMDSFINLLAQSRGVDATEVEEDLAKRAEREFIDDVYQRQTDLSNSDSDSSSEEDKRNKVSVSVDVHLEKQDHTSHKKQPDDLSEAEILSTVVEEPHHRTERSTNNNLLEAFVYLLKQRGELKEENTEHSDEVTLRKTVQSESALKRTGSSGPPSFSFNESIPVNGELVHGEEIQGSFQNQPTDFLAVLKEINIDTDITSTFLRRSARYSAKKLNPEFQVEHEEKDIQRDLVTPEEAGVLHAEHGTEKLIQETHVELNKSELKSEILEFNEGYLNTGLSEDWERNRNLEASSSMLDSLITEHDSQTVGVHTRMEEEAEETYLNSKKDVHMYPNFDHRDPSDSGHLNDMLDSLIHQSDNQETGEMDHQREEYDTGAKVQSEVKAIHTRDSTSVTVDSAIFGRETNEKKDSNFSDLLENFIAAQESGRLENSFTHVEVSDREQDRNKIFNQGTYHLVRGETLGTTDLLDELIGAHESRTVADINTHRADIKHDRDSVKPSIHEIEYFQRPTEESFNDELLNNLLKGHSEGPVEDLNFDAVHDSDTIVSTSSAPTVHKVYIDTDRNAETKKFGTVLDELINSHEAIARNDSSSFILNSETKSNGNTGIHLGVSGSKQQNDTSTFLNYLITEHESDNLQTSIITDQDSRLNGKMVSGDIYSNQSAAVDIYSNQSATVEKDDYDDFLRDLISPKDKDHKENYQISDVSAEKDSYKTSSVIGANDIEGHHFKSGKTNDNFSDVLDDLIKYHDNAQIETNFSMVKEPARRQRSYQLTTEFGGNVDLNSTSETKSAGKKGDMLEKLISDQELKKSDGYESRVRLRETKVTESPSTSVPDKVTEKPSTSVPDKVTESPSTSVPDKVTEKPSTSVPYNDNLTSVTEDDFLNRLLRGQDTGSPAHDYTFEKTSEVSHFSASASVPRSEQPTSHHLDKTDNANYPMDNTNREGIGDILDQLIDAHERGRLDSRLPESEAVMVTRTGGSIRDQSARVSVGGDTFDDDEMQAVLNSLKTTHKDQYLEPEVKVQNAEETSSWQARSISPPQSVSYQNQTEVDGLQSGMLDNLISVQNNASLETGVKADTTPPDVYWQKRTEIQEVSRNDFDREKIPRDENVSDMLDSLITARNNALDDDTEVKKERKDALTTARLNDTLDSLIDGHENSHVQTEDKFESGSISRTDGKNMLDSLIKAQESENLTAEIEVEQRSRLEPEDSYVLDSLISTHRSTTPENKVTIEHGNSLKSEDMDILDSLISAHETESVAAQVNHKLQSSVKTDGIDLLDSLISAHENKDFEQEVRSDKGRSLTTGRLADMLDSLITDHETGSYEREVKVDHVVSVTHNRGETHESVNFEHQAGDYDRGASFKSDHLVEQHENISIAAEYEPDLTTATTDSLYSIPSATADFYSNKITTPNTESFRDILDNLIESHESGHLGSNVRVHQETTVYSDVETEPATFRDTHSPVSSEINTYFNNDAVNSIHHNEYENHDITSREGNNILRSLSYTAEDTTDSHSLSFQPAEHDIESLQDTHVNLMPRNELYMTSERQSYYESLPPPESESEEYGSEISWKANDLAKPEGEVSLANFQLDEIQADEFTQDTKFESTESHTLIASTSDVDRSSISVKGEDFSDILTNLATSHYSGDLDITDVTDHVTLRESQSETRTSHVDDVKNAASHQSFVSHEEMSHEDLSHEDVSYEVVSHEDVSHADVSPRVDNRDVNYSVYQNLTGAPDSFIDLPPAGAQDSFVDLPPPGAHDSFVDLPPPLGIKKESFDTASKIRGYGISTSSLSNLEVSPEPNRPELFDTDSSDDDLPTTYPMHNLDDIIQEESLKLNIEMNELKVKESTSLGQTSIDNSHSMHDSRSASPDHRHRHDPAAADKKSVDSFVNEVIHQSLEHIKGEADPDKHAALKQEVDGIVLDDKSNVAYVTESFYQASTSEQHQTQHQPHHYKDVSHHDHKQEVNTATFNAHLKSESSSDDSDDEDVDFYLGFRKDKKWVNSFVNNIIQESLTTVRSQDLVVETGRFVPPEDFSEDDEREASSRNNSRSSSISSRRRSSSSSKSSSKSEVDSKIESTLGAAMVEDNISEENSRSTHTLSVVDVNDNLDHPIGDFYLDQTDSTHLLFSPTLNRHFENNAEPVIFSTQNVHTSHVPPPPVQDLNADDPLDWTLDKDFHQEKHFAHEARNDVSNLDSATGEYENVDLHVETSNKRFDDSSVDSHVVVSKSETEKFDQVEEDLSSAQSLALNTSFPTAHDNSQTTNELDVSKEQHSGIGEHDYSLTLHGQAKQHFDEEEDSVADNVRTLARQFHEQEDEDVTEDNRANFQLKVNHGLFEEDSTDFRSSTAYKDLITPHINQTEEAERSIEMARPHSPAEMIANKLDDNRTRDLTDEIRRQHEMLTPGLFREDDAASSTRVVYVKRSSRGSVSASSIATDEGEVRETVFDSTFFTGVIGGQRRSIGSESDKSSGTGRMSLKSESSSVKAHGLSRKRSERSSDEEKKGLSRGSVSSSDSEDADEQRRKVSLPSEFYHRNNDVEAEHTSEVHVGHKLFSRELSGPDVQADDGVSSRRSSRSSSSSSRRSSLDDDHLVDKTLIPENFSNVTHKTLSAEETRDALHSFERENKKEISNDFKKIAATSEDHDLEEYRVNISRNSFILKDHSSVDEGVMSMPHLDGEADKQKEDESHLFSKDKFRAIRNIFEISEDHRADKQKSVIVKRNSSNLGSESSSHSSSSKGSKALGSELAVGQNTFAGDALDYQFRDTETTINIMTEADHSQHFSSVEKHPFVRETERRLSSASSTSSGESRHENNLGVREEQQDTDQADTPEHHLHDLITQKLSRSSASSSSSQNSKSSSGNSSRRESRIIEDPASREINMGKAHLDFHSTEYHPEMFHYSNTESVSDMHSTKQKQLSRSSSEGSTSDRDHIGMFRHTGTSSGTADVHEPGDTVKEGPRRDSSSDDSDNRSEASTTSRRSSLLIEDDSLFNPTGSKPDQGENGKEYTLQVVQNMCEEKMETSRETVDERISHEVHEARQQSRKSSSSSSGSKKEEELIGAFLRSSSRSNVSEDGNFTLLKRKISRRLSQDSEKSSISSHSKTGVELENKTTQFLRPRSDSSPSESSDEEGVYVSEQVSRGASEQVSRGVSEQVSRGVSEQVSRGVSQQVSRGVSEQVSRGVSEQVSRGVSEQVSRGVSEQVLEVNRLEEEADITDETSIIENYLNSLGVVVHETGTPVSAKGEGIPSHFEESVTYVYDDAHNHSPVLDNSDSVLQSLWRVSSNMGNSLTQNTAHTYDNDKGDFLDSHSHQNSTSILQSEVTSSTRAMPYENITKVEHRREISNHTENPTRVSRPSSSTPRAVSPEMGLETVQRQRTDIRLTSAVSDTTPQSASAKLVKRRDLWSSKKLNSLDQSDSSSDEKSKPNLYVIKKSHSHNASLDDISAEIFHHKSEIKPTAAELDTAVDNMHEERSSTPHVVVDGPVHRIIHSPRSQLLRSVSSDAAVSLEANSERLHRSEESHQTHNERPRNIYDNKANQNSNPDSSFTNIGHYTKNPRGRPRSLKSNQGRQHHSPDRFFKNAKLSLRKEDSGNRGYYSDDESKRQYRMVTRIFLSEDQPDAPEIQSVDFTNNQVYQVGKIRHAGSQQNGQAASSGSDDSDSGFQANSKRYRVIGTSESSLDNDAILGRSSPRFETKREKTFENTLITQTQSVRPSLRSQGDSLTATRSHVSVVKREIDGGVLTERQGFAVQPDSLYVSKRIKSAEDLLRETAEVVSQSEQNVNEFRMWRAGRSRSTENHRTVSSSDDGEDFITRQQSNLFQSAFVKTKRQESDENKTYVVKSAVTPSGWHASTIDINAHNTHKAPGVDPFALENTSSQHGPVQGERFEFHKYKMEKTSPSFRRSQISQKTNHYISQDSGQGTEAADSDLESDLRLNPDNFEQLHEIGTEAQLPEQFRSTEDLSKDFRVLHGKILIKNRLDDSDHRDDDLNENVNLFDTSFHLGRDNPLFSSDPDLRASLLREEQQELSRQVFQDITYETVDKFAQGYKSNKQVQLSPGPQRKRQNLSGLLLAKLATVDSKDITQTVDVEHHNEEIQGNINFVHADGEQKESHNTYNFDSVNERVELTLTQGKANVMIKVIAERIVPADLEFQVWRKSQAVVTRQIQIDLQANEQRRQLYQHVMSQATISAGSLENGGKGAGQASPRSSRQERQMNSMETLKLFSQILDVAEGQGDADRVATHLREETGQLPTSIMDLMY